MRPIGRDKRDTNRIGEISEAAIITRFLQLGYVVLTPYGGNQRYDLVIEDANHQFWRVQCKTARIDESGSMLRFNTSISNVTGKNRQPRHYLGECDFFAAYNEELNKIYLVPVEKVGTINAKLRITPAKKDEENIQWAKDYEL